MQSLQNYPLIPNWSENIYVKRERERERERKRDRDSDRQTERKIDLVSLFNAKAILLEEQ